MFVQVCLVGLSLMQFLSLPILSVPKRYPGICNCRGHIQCTFCTLQVSKCHFCLLNFPFSPGLSHLLNSDITYIVIAALLLTLSLFENINYYYCNCCNGNALRECDLRRWCGWGAGLGQCLEETLGLCLSLSSLLTPLCPLSSPLCCQWWPPAGSVMLPPSLTTCIIITGPNMVQWIPSIKMQSCCCFRVLIAFYGIVLMPVLYTLNPIPNPKVQLGLGLTL